MMNQLKQIILATVALVVLTACGASQTIMDDSMGNGGRDDGANTQGTGADGGVDGSGSGNGMDLSGSLQTVFYFDYDRSTLTYETRQALDRHASNLRSSSRSVRLEGHADDRGTREYNLALGERRAKSIADYLVLQGVPRAQLESISYGEEKPIAFSQNEESYRLNRRVELK